MDMMMEIQLRPMALYHCRGASTLPTAFSGWHSRVDLLINAGRIFLSIGGLFGETYRFLDEGEMR